MSSGPAEIRIAYTKRQCRRVMIQGKFCSLVKFEVFIFDSCLVRLDPENREALFLGA